MSGPGSTSGMPGLKTPLEVYRLLPKANCGECGVATCLAFASEVLKQGKKPSDCPRLDQDAVAGLDGKIERPANLETIQEETAKELRGKVALLDLGSRAARLGARMSGESMVLQCLGRDFELDRSGNLKSNCHTHAWFSIPLFDYVLQGCGEDIGGQWVPFRELKSGRTWNRLFEQRCEKPLKRLADARPLLFEDLIGLFSGRSSPGNFSADISVVLRPLPKIPVLICYWNPEDDLESRLHIFFDSKAERNLPVQSLFTLATGIVRMFEKVMQKHADGNFELP